MLKAIVKLINYRLNAITIRTSRKPHVWLLVILGVLAWYILVPWALVDRLGGAALDNNWNVVLFLLVLFFPALVVGLVEATTWRLLVVTPTELKVTLMGKVVFECKKEMVKSIEYRPTATGRIAEFATKIFGGPSMSRGAMVKVMPFVITTTDGRQYSARISSNSRMALNHDYLGPNGYPEMVEAKHQ